MLVSYPALFYYDDSQPTKYFISFPDINGPGTQGTSIPDAMYMASDYLGMMLSDDIEADRKVPSPSAINELSLTENNPFKDDPDLQLTFDADKSFISMVSVDISEYLGSQEPIKKTLTIPKWADKLGRDMHLNFSQTLTEAIANKKIDL